MIITNKDIELITNILLSIWSIVGIFSEIKAFLKNKSQKKLADRQLEEEIADGFD